MQQGDEYMKAEQVFFSGYTVGGSEIYDSLSAIAGVYGSRVVVIEGIHGIAACRELLEAGMAKADLTVTGHVYYGGEASFANREQLISLLEVQQADMIFAVGGGKVIDTAKMVGKKLDKPVFTFPTIASNCAAISDVSIVYTEEHRFSDVDILPQPPVHCFINIEIISQAPWQYTWAGIGDTMAKYYEPLFASRGRILDHTNQMGMYMSRMCIDPVLQSGCQALADCRQGKASEALKQIVLNTIISTGMVGHLVNEEYNSAIAHAVNYGLLELPGVEEHHLHGEIVAYGLLIHLAVDGQNEAFGRVYDFNTSIGLPVTLAHFGADKNDAATLRTIADTAAEVIRLKVMPYEVTSDMIQKAILFTEQYR